MYTLYVSRLSHIDHNTRVDLLAFATPRSAPNNPYKFFVEKNSFLRLFALYGWDGMSSIQGETMYRFIYME